MRILSKMLQGATKAIVESKPVTEVITKPNLKVGKLLSLPQAENTAEKLAEAGIRKYRV